MNVIPRSIVIVVSTGTAQLDKTQKFLESRGWKVQIVSGSINKGVQVATAFDPDYLFISIEVLPPSMNHLYAALKKSYRTVLFSEKAGVRTVHVLQDLHAPDVLVTPLNGPTIERLINKFERAETAAEPLPMGSLGFDLSQADLNRLGNAVDQSIKNTTTLGKKRHRLDKAKRIHCFAVRTARLSGYMALASADGLGEEYTDHFKQQLMHSLNAKHDFFRIGDTHSFDIEEVAFEGLATNLGEFFRTSVHSDKEVGITFFRIPDVDLHVSESEVPGWISTDISEISHETPIDFDIFVYMPINKKFVLYRRAGNFLERTQKDSLENHGVNKIHLKRESLPALHRYKAKKHIHSLVHDYQSDITAVSVA